ncbi:MAG: N-6 DNA methylase [Helicobacteraceae bacterium]|nr:N-6 DNA methylase [Helicobacteraceae bacterium]
MTINIQRYKQFFTPKKYSQILVEKILYAKPEKIVDLTMGEGSLLLEASRMWKGSNLFGNDIDSKCCKKVQDIIPEIHCYNKDIFLDTSIKSLIKKIGTVDICLGNPPFYLIKQNKDSLKILKLFSLEGYYKASYISAEVLFILQALRILKNGGLLSVILPDGFFVNNALKKFRIFLITEYTILDIIELPSEIFEHTKAKTHILVLKKSKSISKTIKLSSIVKEDSIFIKKDDAYNRMDYSFYESYSNYSNYKKLEKYDVEIFRGKPKFMLKDIKETWILHTTNFRFGNDFKSPLKTNRLIKKYIDRIAFKNDIIIPRVGTSILGKVGVVQSGYFIATDCVFIIRVKNENDRKDILYTLNSQFGKDWIKSISKGVGARHITLTDIAKMPIIEKEHKNNEF